MTIGDISMALRGSCKNQAFITLSEICEACDYKNHQQFKHKYLSGLEAVDGKYYLISEVSKRLYERREYVD